MKNTLIECKLAVHAVRNAKRQKNGLTAVKSFFRRTSQFRVTYTEPRSNIAELQKDLWDKIDGRMKRDHDVT